MVEVVKYLYNFGIVYWDLKCENILIMCDKWIVFFDFGFLWLYLDE